MASGRSVVLRVSEEWLRRVGLLLNQLGQGSRSRSSLLRQTVEKEVQCWVDAPYYAEQASHFLFVTSSGDIYYRVVENLNLQDVRRQLYCSVDLNPKLRGLLGAKYSGQPNESDAIRSHWLLNHFSVWSGRDISTEPISSHVDRLGRTSKDANLVVNQSRDTYVTREMVFSIRDYLRPNLHEDGGSLEDDTFHIAIKNPTKHIEVQVLVDLDLYGEGYRSESSSIAFDFGNGEFARYQRPFLGSEHSKTSVWADRYPDALFRDRGYESNLNAVQSAFASLQSRVMQLASESALGQDGLSIVANSDDRNRLRSLALPQRFLIGRLEWKAPYQGLVILPSWSKSG